MYNRNVGVIHWSHKFLLSLQLVFKFFFNIDETSDFLA